MTHFRHLISFPWYSTMDKVDATMTSIQEQRDIANEVSEAISNPLNAGIDLDDVREARWRPY